MECHTFEARQRYMEKPLRWLPHSGYWIGSHFFTQPISLNTDCMHRINILYNTWWGNKKHLLCELPRSGWSVGRAGLGVKRPTLPKRCILSFKAVGLGLFPFNTLLRRRMCKKRSSLSCHSACLSMPFSPSHMSNYTTNNQRHMQANYQNVHDLRTCGNIGRGLVKWNNSYNLHFSTHKHSANVRAL